MPGGLSMHRSDVFLFFLIGFAIGMVLHSNLVCIALAYFSITILAFIQWKIERSKKGFIYAWLSGVIAYSLTLAWLLLFDHLQSLY
ncbi:MAG: hypothetical protein WC495_04230 [Patescibacteria group bacterium]|jgi:hypothetical protein